MKRIPIDKRKVSTTFALSRSVLEKLDKIQEHCFSGKSRSYALEEIITDIFNAWFSDQERTEEVPDDVSEVGYNPYTGSYEEDL